MAVPQRPTSVTIIAVLNFVFGALGLLGALCGGVSMLIFNAMIDNMAKQPGPGGGPNPFAEMKGLFTGIPGYIPFIIASTILGSVMAVVLITAGIGLLKMKGWGRWLSFVYALVTILSTIGSTVYTIAVVNPAMEKWQAEFQQKMQAKMPGGGAGAPPPPNPMGGAGSAVISVAAAIFSIAYSVAILVVLNLPDVRRAFARAAGGVVDEPETDYLDSGPRFGRPRNEDDRFQRPDEGFKT